jgi:hypothetical protein
MNIHRSAGKEGGYEKGEAFLGPPSTPFYMYSRLLDRYFKTT